MKTGLIMSGGGARGFAHIGVLKVLDEKNIKINAIAGSSMGSVIGAFYAAGLSGKEIEVIFKGITWKDILRVIDLSFKNIGILRGHKLMNLIESKLPVKTFEKLKIPLVVNATNILTGKEVAFRKGSLIKAIRSSICFPGFLVPYETSEGLLMDGGLVNPLAIGLFDKSIRHQIIVDVDTGFGGKVNLENPNLMDLMKCTTNIMQDELVKLKLDTVKTPYILIQPKVRNFELYDIKNIDEIILLGENEALRHFDEL